VYLHFVHAKMHSMTLDWDDLKTVLHVVRAGTLSGAAAQLGINYTTVARRVARVEARLQRKLFERLSDGYRPTELGRLVAAHAEQMEVQDHALMRGLSGRDETLRGPLVITAPQLLIQWHLVHVIEAFCTAHPEVDLEVNAANDLLDLGRRQADLAVRVSREPGDNLTGMRLTAQHAAAYGSPGLAARIAEHPNEPVDWVVYSQSPGAPKAALERYPQVRIKARFDDMVPMIGAAQAGLGLVRMPMFLGRAVPGLVEVPVMPPQPYADIWAVAHADVWPGAKVRAFREGLVTYFRANRGVFVA
jgi:DNA-binding transcriptional LysR family regulator